MAKTARKKKHSKVTLNVINSVRGTEPDEIKSLGFGVLAFPGRGIYILNGPKAFPGDEVDVRQYRTTDKDWEEGTVQSVETHWVQIGGSGEWRARHHYRICLFRRSKKGNYLFLTVGDDGIKTGMDVLGE